MHVCGGRQLSSARRPRPCPLLPCLPQVCGILLVLVGGGHMVLWWGMACFPAARHTFALLYYACGAASVWAALHAKSALGRGLPMLGLLAIRLASHAARLVLEGGAPSPALSHYLWMEVGGGRRCTGH